MSRNDPDPSSLVSDTLKAWYGHDLPPDVAQRAGADLGKLMEAFRQLPPPPFDLQVYHFAPLLEALADD